MNQIPIRQKQVNMDLSLSEVKFINRLRMLRKAAGAALLLVTVNPLTVSVIGQTENLEDYRFTPPTSGSGL